MAPVKIADILCPDAGSLETTAASTTDVKHLSFYNWIETSAPTIAIPGSPPLWTPPKDSQKVARDTGLIYIAQNAARHPENPLEPLFAPYTPRILTRTVVRAAYEDRFIISPKQRGQLHQWNRGLFAGRPSDDEGKETEEESSEPGYDDFGES